MKKCGLWVVGAIASVVVSASALAAVIVPDNGFGNIDFPTATYVVCPGYPNFKIIDGLPGGTTIDIAASLGQFNITNQGPGGTLAGDFQQWTGMLDFNPMLGTGTLLGFNRSISIPVQGETHTGPRSPSFASDLFLLHGQVIGDPDFDLLRITAGGGFGLPSPGNTTLTPAGPNWSVDSFFDITYRIDFVGAPGGALAGRSGSTTQMTRIWLVPSPAGAALAGLAMVGVLRRRRASAD
jgi:hypothetical protein